MQTHLLMKASGKVVTENGRCQQVVGNPLPDEHSRRRAPERDGLERPRRHEQEARARRGQGRARGGMNYLSPFFYHHHHPCTEDAVSASKSCLLPPKQNDVVASTVVVKHSGP